MNQLSLGITIALRDAFSARARRISRGFSSLDDTAYRAARGISRSAAIIEEQIYNITRTLAASVALLSSVIWPTKKAAEFGEGIARIATIADYANTNLKQVADTLIEQSFRFPTTPLQQAETAYRAVSSGFIDTASALKVVEEATETAVTTLTTSDKALRALTGILNAYSLTADYAEIVADRLFETTRYGRILMEELGKYVGYGASAAAIGGINMEDFLSAVAVMTLGSLSPEQSFQYLRQLIIGTLKPTAQASRIGEQYGIKFGKEAIAQFGGDWTGWLMHAYDTIVGQGGSIEDFARLLSGRQAFAGAATLINLRKKLDEVKRGMANRYVLDDFGVLMSSRQRALSIQSRELTYQLQRLTSGWDAVFTVMGRVSAEAIRPIVTGFADLTGYVLKAVQTFPLLSKAIMGVVTAMSAGTLVFGLYQISQLKQSKAIIDMAKAAAATELPIWGMTLNLKNFVKVASGAFLILGGLITLLKHAYERSKLLGESFDANGRIINEGANVWGNLYGKIQKVRTLFFAVSTYFQNLEGTVGHIPLELANQLRAMGLWNHYRQLVMIGGRLLEFFKGVRRGIVDTFKDMGRGIQSALFGVADWLERTFGMRGAAQHIRRFAQDFMSVLQWSGLDTWQNIGVAVGKVVAVVGTLVAVTKLWRSAVLFTVGTWKAAIAPLKLIKALMWSGPKAVLGGMAGLVGRGAGLAGKAAAHGRVGLWYYSEVAKDGFFAMDRWLTRTHRRAYEMASAIPGAFNRMGAGIAASFARMRTRVQAARGFSLMRFLAGTPDSEWTRYNRRTGMFERGYWGKGRKKGVFMRQAVISPRDAGFLSRLYAIHVPNAWETIKKGARGVAKGARALPGRAMAGVQAMGAKTWQVVRTGALQAGAAIGGAFAGGIAKAAVAFKALTAFMLGPWGLAIGAVIAGTILIIKHWDKVKGAFLAVGKFIWRVFQWVGSGIAWVGQKVWNMIPEPVQKRLISFFERIKSLGNAAFEMVKAGVEKLRGPFSWMLDILKSILNFTLGTNFQKSFKLPAYLHDMDAINTMDQERLRAIISQQEDLLNEYLGAFNKALVDGVISDSERHFVDSYRVLRAAHEVASRRLEELVGASAGLNERGLQTDPDMAPDVYDGMENAVAEGAARGIREGLDDVGVNNMLSNPDFLRAWEGKVGDPYAAYRDSYRQELAKNYQQELVDAKRAERGQRVADEVVRLVNEVKEAMKRQSEALLRPVAAGGGVILLDGEVLGRFTSDYESRRQRTEIDRTYTQGMGQ